MAYEETTMTSVEDPYASLGYTQLADGSLQFGTTVIGTDGSVYDGTTGTTFTAEQLQANPSYLDYIKTIMPSSDTMRTAAPYVTTLGSAALGYANSQNQLDASRRGTDAAIGAYNSGLGQQRTLAEQQAANFAPYQALGVQGLSELQQFNNPNYSYLGSPSAKYALQQGTKALNSQMAARGMLGSGQAATALGNLASGVAAQDYETAYNRSLNNVKIGQGAAGSANAAWSGLGSQIGTNAFNTGNVLNQGYQNQGAARTGLYGNLWNSVAAGGDVYNWMNPSKDKKQGE